MIQPASPLNGSPTETAGGAGAEDGVGARAADELTQQHKAATGDSQESLEENGVKDHQRGASERTITRHEPESAAVNEANGLPEAREAREEWGEWEESPLQHQQQPTLEVEGEETGVNTWQRQRQQR